MGVETMTDTLKKYAAARSLICRSHVAQDLGLTAQQTDNAINRLYRRGLLRRVDAGVYEFVKNDTDGDDVDEKMWRAMRVSTTFTTADIERLAGARPAVVHRFVRQMLQDGYIKPSGMAYTAGDRRHGRKQYRLTLAGQDASYRPGTKPYTPDKLVADTAALNRLVCTGLAQHDEQALKEAISLCGTILTHLTDMQGGA